MHHTRFAVLCLAGTLACSGGPDRNPVTAAFAQRPPDRGAATPVVFRFPGDRGGSVRVYRLPRLDEVAFRFDAPGLTAASVAGYSDDNDQVYVVSPRNTLLALDLATGRSRTIDSAVASIVTGPAGTPYIIHADGGVSAVEHRVPIPWSTRLAVGESTPIGAGRGTLLVERRGENDVRELIAITASRPPVVQAMPHGPATSSLWGDVVLVGSDTGFVLIDPTRSLAPRHLLMDRPLVAVAVAPAGHRLYGLTGPQLIVGERFSNTVLTHIDLPGSGRELRLDPLGRLILIRPSAGDSVWVIDATTNRYIATIKGDWDADLPAIAPDGTLLTRQGTDLVALASDSLTPVGRVRAVATDRWLPVEWDPRRPALELAAEAVTAAPGSGDEIYVQVSFSLNESWARDNAANLQRAGLEAKVLPPNGPDDGYRVVLGPYPSREAAEAAGRKFGRSYWVFSRGTPPTQ